MVDTDLGVSVVIGGANGIGAACCHVMSSRGWRVMVVDIDAAAAAATADEVGGFAHTVDITSLDSLERLAGDVEREHGPVRSLVVSSAAFQERFAPDQFPMELFRKVLQVNIEGTFNANRVFGTQMAGQGGGSIVNVASTTAHASSPLLAYGPTKAAVINLSRALAAQWGRSGVRVNSVSPGATVVPRVLARAPGRYATDINQQMALGRRVEAVEVAEAIEFLASTRASAITGVDLVVDAGLLVAGSWGLYGGVPEVCGAAQP